MEEIWIEKYRPTNLSEVVGQSNVTDRLKNYVKERSMPHLLFAGPAGIGKTTSALALAKEMFGEVWKHNLHELNASDERGIDVVRGKIKEFARTAPLGEDGFKIIFLDIKHFPLHCPLPPVPCFLPLAFSLIALGLPQVAF